MPFREGSKPNQPFVISNDDLSSQFTVLSAQETAKLGGPEGSKSREPRKGEKLSLEQAETIIGRENFFGPEAVEKAFGRRLEWEEIPEMPFTQTELERAQELGQFLVLRVDRAGDNDPLTPAKMFALWEGRAASEDNGKFLVDNSWYEAEEFYTNDTPVSQSSGEPKGDKLNTRWALVSSELIPNTVSKHYLDQTKTIVEYTQNEVFKGQSLPEEFAEAIQEYNQYVAREFAGKTPEQIRTLLHWDSTWKKYSAELGDLKINQLTRHSPAEVFYDMQIRFLNSSPDARKRLLENKYTWTNRRASGGDLVDVGGFDAGGAGVGSWRPGSSDDDFGVSFSRSL